MRRTASLLSLAVALAVTPLAVAQNAPATMLSGCLTGNRGSFTLGAVPNGSNYRLTGNVAALNGHAHQLVRITGHRLAATNGAQSGAFEVQSVQVLAGTCTAPLPSSTPQAVTGKTGVDATAVPQTTTATAGQVTPGAETEAGRAQQPGAHPRPGQRNQPPRQGPLAPPQWGQVGQSERSANRSAAAAERAEEEPSHTLGVNAMPTQKSATRHHRHPKKKKKNATHSTPSSAPNAGPSATKP